MSKDFRKIVIYNTINISFTKKKFALEDIAQEIEQRKETILKTLLVPFERLQKKL